MDLSPQNFRRMHSVPAYRIHVCGAGERWVWAARRFWSLQSFHVNRTPASVQERGIEVTAERDSEASSIVTSFVSQSSQQNLSIGAILWSVDPGNTAAIARALARVSLHASTQVLQFVAVEHVSRQTTLQLTELGVSALVRVPEDLARLQPMIFRHASTTGVEGRR